MVIQVGENICAFILAMDSYHGQDYRLGNRFSASKR